MLVGTVSVDKSEELSKLLKKEKIAHTILNAKQHEKEAAIIANAGTSGAVTISTNMAGRGTDIMLGGNPEFLAKERLREEGFSDDIVALATGTSETDNADILAARAKFSEYLAEFKEKIQPDAEKVRRAGGLFIIGTERHESRRIDNQLRGRSGRQGDPGESRFYLSLEDDLLRLFGSEKMMGLASLGIEKDMPIEAKILSGAIERAQKSIEARNFSSRKHVLSYDDVMNHQRKIIYAQRYEILTQDDISEKIESLITRSVEEKFDEIISNDPLGQNEFFSYYGGALNSAKIQISDSLSQSELEEYKAKLTKEALRIYRSKDELFAKVDPGRNDSMREIERAIFLRNIDKEWMDHLEALDDLKGYVGLNSYAQRDPVTMFKLESAEMFEDMTREIREATGRKLLTGLHELTKIERTQVVKTVGYGSQSQSAPVKRQPAVSKHKSLGANDKCHCGSGKKYKNCCRRKDLMNN